MYSGSLTVAKKIQVSILRYYSSEFGICWSKLPHSRFYHKLPKCTVCILGIVVEECSQICLTIDFSWQASQKKTFFFFREYSRKWCTDINKRTSSSTFPSLTPGLLLPNTHCSPWNYSYFAALSVKCFVPWLMAADIFSCFLAWLTH